MTETSTLDNAVKGIQIHYEAAPLLKDVQPRFRRVVHDDETLMDLRHTVRSLCQGLHMGDRDLLITTVVSEPVTNALNCQEAGSCEVVAVTRSNELVVDVIDHGSGIGPDKVGDYLQFGHSSHDSLGYGFSIMAKVCKEVNLYDTPGGLTVRLGFSL